jgi:hypothetical protein
MRGHLLCLVVPDHVKGRTQCVLRWEHYTMDGEVKGLLGVGNRELNAHPRHRGLFFGSGSIALPPGGQYPASPFPLVPEES